MHKIEQFEGFFKSQLIDLDLPSNYIDYRSNYLYIIYIVYDKKFENNT